MIVAGVDSGVKTIYSSPTASNGTTCFFEQPKEPIVITRPASTHPQKHALRMAALVCALPVGGAFMGKHFRASAAASSWTNGYEDGPHPGMEDV